MGTHCIHNIKTNFYPTYPFRSQILLKEFLLIAQDSALKHSSRALTGRRPRRMSAGNSCKVSIFSSCVLRLDLCTLDQASSIGQVTAIELIGKAKSLRKRECVDIRPEISEQVSVGIIFSQNGRIDFRYSNVKLKAVRLLVSEEKYNYLRRMLVSWSSRNPFDSVAIIDYLNRYSNNILTVSEIRKVKMGTDRLTMEGLYKMYVYRRTA